MFRSYISISLKVFLAIALWFISFICFLQEDTWFIQNLESSIEKRIYQDSGFFCNCNIKQLNFLTGTLLLGPSKLSSSPKQDTSLNSNYSNSGQWSISGPATLIDISWLSWFSCGMSKVFKAQVTFYSPEIFSTQRASNLAIAEPIYYFANMPTLYIGLDSVTLKHAKFSVKGDLDLNYNFLFSSNINFYQDGYSILSSFLEGSLKYKDQELFDCLNGSSSLFINPDGLLKNANGHYSANLNNKFFNTKADNKNKLDQAIILTWEYFKNSGSLSVYTVDRSTNIKTEYKKNSKKDNSNWSINCDLTLPVNSFYNIPVNGNLLGTIEAELDLEAGRDLVKDYLNYKFSFKTDTLSAYGFQLGQVFIKGHGDRKELAGTLKVKDIKNRALAGSWQAKIDSFLANLYLTEKDNKKDAVKPTSTTATKSDQALENLKDNKKDASTKSYLSAQVTATKIEADWSLFKSKELKDSKKLSTGKLTYNFSQEDMLSLSGDFDQYKYLLELKNNPLRINKFYLESEDGPDKSNSKDAQLKNQIESQLKDGQLKDDQLLKEKNISKTLINFTGKENKLAYGFIDWDFVNQLIKSYTGYSLTGSAVLKYSLKPFTQNFRSKISIKKSSLDFPLSNNILTSGSALVGFDFLNKRILFQDLRVNFQQGGSCSSAFASIGFTETGHISDVKFPVSFDNYLLKIKEDFSGLLSGELTFTANKSGEEEDKTCKKDMACDCVGQIFVDQASLKANILSSDFQKNFMEQAINKSSGIDSDNKSSKNINLAVKLISKSPIEIKTEVLNVFAKLDLLVTGTVEKPKISGIIDIVGGFLKFPYQNLDISSGKLSLNSDKPEDIIVELTAKNIINSYPVTLKVNGSLAEPVVLLESPGLNKAQIITLLLTGSNDGSLYWAMPKLVMQYLKSLIFGSSDENSISLSSLLTLFNSFRKINFSSQSEEDSNQNIK